MTVSTAKNIQAALKKVANPEIAKHSQGFFKTGKGEYGEGDVFLGIRVPELRKHAKYFKDAPLPEVIKLLHSHVHEERLTALLILVLQFAKADEPGRKIIYDSYLTNTQYINNWDLVDTSAHPIVGGFLNDKDRSVLKKLAKSKLIWERRIAMISTYHFIKQNDLETTFVLAEILVDDKEDLMHKAVGWMLREAGKRDRKKLEAFLDKHGKTMPRTMLRYAIEKFSKEERKAYLLGKS